MNLNEMGEEITRQIQDATDRLHTLEGLENESREAGDTERTMRWQARQAEVKASIATLSYLERAANRISTDIFRGISEIILGK